MVEITIGTFNFVCRYVSAKLKVLSAAALTVNAREYDYISEDFESFVADGVWGNAIGCDATVTNAFAVCSDVYRGAGQKTFTDGAA